VLGNDNLCRCKICGRLDRCTDSKKVDGGGRYICSVCQRTPPEPPKPVNTWEEAKPQPERSEDV
jgi:hypothetical protein